MATKPDSNFKIEAFCDRIDAYFEGERADIARRDINRYFESESETFTGRHYEALADVDQPNIITERDLLAVEMLSVTVPPRVSVWILGDGRERIQTILQDVPTDKELSECPEAITKDGPLVQLWKLLRYEADWPVGRGKGNGMGRTKTSKLIAVKRPMLAPVLDNVVCSALGPVSDFWSAFAVAFQDGKRREQIQNVRPAACPASLLRVIDVVVWMAEQHPRPDDIPVRPR